MDDFFWISAPLTRKMEKKLENFEGGDPGGNETSFTVFKKHCLVYYKLYIENINCNTKDAKTLESA